MKQLLGILTIGFCTLTYQTASAQNDAKAKTILDAVSKKVNGLKSLKANFTLNLAGANGKTKQSKSGTFFMKGTKYRVVLPEQEIICDNKTVWTYVKDNNEVQVNNFNPNEQTISPTKLFTNFYDKEYKYTYVGSKKAGGKTVEVIQLVPTSNSKQFSKVELMVDKSSSTIVGGSITEKNGNHYTYTISNFTPNATLADNMFTFDTREHKGVEVVDLR